MKNLMKERIQNGELKRLSNMELQFMRFIPIYEHFPQPRGTKSTVLYNISEKGYVEKVQQGLHHFYRALVKEAYRQPQHPILPPFSRRRNPST